jgi:hypothetical protein
MDADRRLPRSKVTRRPGRPRAYHRAMTRFVVDSTAVIHIAKAQLKIPAKHELLAPTLLRSQTLSALHEAVHRASSQPRRRATSSRAWDLPG